MQGKEYRLLKKGDKIKEGDELYGWDAGCVRLKWHKIECDFGIKYNPEKHVKVRREVTNETA